MTAQTRRATLSEAEAITARLLHGQRDLILSIAAEYRADPATLLPQLLMGAVSYCQQANPAATIQMIRATADMMQGGPAPDLMQRRDHAAGQLIQSAQALNIRQKRRGMN